MATQRIIEKRIGGVASVLSIVLLSACSSLRPSFDETPLAAQIYVTAEPTVAARPLELLLLNTTEEVNSRVAFRAGERIVAQLATVGGAHTLEEADGSCSIDLDPIGGQEIDVRINQPDDGRCAFDILGRHAIGNAPHLSFGTLAVTLVGHAPTPESRVTIRSLDVPPNPVPEPLAPDESGRFFFDSLAPGKYEVQAMSNSAIVGRQQVEIGAGAAAAASAEISIVPFSSR